MRWIELVLVGWLCAFAAPEAIAQFGPAIPLAPDQSDPGLRAVDLDGDTDLDLVGLFDNNQFRWHANTDGAADFSTRLDVVATPSVVSQWTIGDVDGDALPDIIVLDEPMTTVYLLRNLGDTQFDAPIVIGTLPSAPGAMRLADITGEGFPDMVFTLSFDITGGGIAWLPNTTGIFEALVNMELSLPGTASTVLLHGDMDEIGGIDLVVTDQNQMVWALRNSFGDGSAWETDTILVVQGFGYEGKTQLIDVDNDGDLDVAEAGAIALHWAENHTGEGGEWSYFTDHILEPWLSAGNGAFGHLGCTAATGIVYVPSNPALETQWSAWTNGLADFAFRTELTCAERGTGLLLADFNGDGHDDLVLTTNPGTAVYLNELQPPTTVLELPVLDSLCMYGPPVDLPQALPAGGRWNGFTVDQNILYRANLNGTGSYPLTHSVYESEGCPIGAATSIYVAQEPTITTLLTDPLCSDQGPIQITSVPVATQWIGIGADGILDPATYDDGVFMALFTDATGETCAAESQPLEVWTSLSAVIEPAGPFCITDGPQLISAGSAPPFGASWSGDISGWNSAGATFLPAQGTGTYSVVLIVEATGPNQCGAVDTLLISVSDAFPEVVVQPLGPQCANGSPIALDAQALPAGGIWSGPGLQGSELQPAILGAGDHLLTYTYFDPEGCAASAALAVNLYDTATVNWTTDDLIFCITDDPVQFNALPIGGTWGTPVDANGVLDPPTCVPGIYTLTYTWQGPNGCTLVNEANTIKLWNTSEVAIDPVGVLCDDAPEVVITGNLSGTWGGTVIGEGTSVLFNPSLLGAGTWPITLTAAIDEQCPGTATVDVLVEVCTGLAEAPSLNSVVSPNPFTDIVTLTLGAVPASSIDVLDAAGRLVLSEGPQAAGARVALDLASTLPGTYILRITERDGGVRTIRIVKV